MHFCFHFWLLPFITILISLHFAFYFCNYHYYILPCWLSVFRGELKKAVDAVTKHQEDVSALSQHNSDLSTQIQHLLKTSMQSSIGGMHRSQVARIGMYEWFECSHSLTHSHSYSLFPFPFPSFLTHTLSLPISLFFPFSISLSLSLYRILEYGGDNNSNASGVISEHLLTFDDVSELQIRNSQLLQVLRKLSVEQVKKNSY